MLAMRYDNRTQMADLVRDGGNLSQEDALYTAVFISLFSDARIEPAEVGPSEVSGGGWWGDAHAEVPGDLFGSKLWRHRRSPASTDTLREVQEDAKDALAWMLEDGIAESISTGARWLARGVGLLTTEIAKPDGSVDKWDWLWRAHADVVP